MTGTVQGRVLVVDDEKNITFVMQAMLEKAGYEVWVSNDPQEALKALAEEDPDVLVTDLYMPGISGMEILKHCQKHRPQLPVVIITAFGTVESAVAAIKQGAFDYITKPFEQTDFINVIRKAVRTHYQRLKEPVPILPLSEDRPAALATSGIGVNPAVSSIIGASAEMQEVFKLIAKISNSPTTVLLQGESGTGKELVAFEIHRNSDRASKPFVKINCAAIPATLIESEMFGYEKGAFTGAVGSKPGRFELANEGTLFLDEVADMPLEMQVKLLRVLQEHEFERVGGVSTIKVDTRIITATNKDLQTEVKAGRFREDLFYRLNVVPIRLPALRERKEDIELLVRFFVQQFNEKLKKQITAITPEVIQSLKAFSWPGNIRQLENVLERMVLMSEGGALTIEDLPTEIQPVRSVAPETESSFKETVRKKTQSVERELIEKALEETGGNVTRASEKLGLSRKGLQLKMKELGLKRSLE